MFICFPVLLNTMKHTVVNTTVPVPVGHVVIKVRPPSFQEFMLAPPPNWICCRYPWVFGGCLMLAGAGFVVLIIYSFGGFRMG
jgi:hypothetical protein